MLTESDVLGLIGEANELYEQLMTEVKRLRVLNFVNEERPKVKRRNSIATSTTADYMMPKGRGMTVMRRALGDQRMRKNMGSNGEDLAADGDYIDSANENENEDRLQDQFLGNDNDENRELMDDEKFEACCANSNIPQMDYDVEIKDAKEARQMLAKYFRLNALRPVNTVEPGRLPYRHDHLLRHEQYVRGWQAMPPPQERSHRADRWRIRQRMAELDVPYVCLTHLRRRAHSVDD